MSCGCIKERELVSSKLRAKKERKAAYDTLIEPNELGAPLTKQPSRRGRDNRLLSKRQNRHRSRAEHRRNNDGVT